MIELFIFHCHILGALYAFIKSWQNQGVKEGFLAVIIIGLAFAILWAMTGTIANLIMPDSWNTLYFTKDTLSLVLLFIPELFFFYNFFLKRKTNLNKAESDPELI